MAEGMAAILAEALYDRGPHVPDWPDDERDLYREVSCRSFREAQEAVKKLRFRKAAEQLAANGYGKLEEATVLIRDLTDPDDCWFDHHGGCQAHGYLSLEPGQTCPQHDAKQWAKTHGRPE